MKFKNMLLATGVALLAAACSSEDGLTGDGGEQRPGIAKKELRLVFGGSGESTEYTRSIASESENKIERLDIYVFAAANGSGDYQYLETWSSADKDNTVARQFVLQGAGTSRKASIFPTELKGVPNLRLYCVANAPTLYQADGTAITPMIPIQTDATTGTITSQGTLATAFEGYLTETMQAAAAAGNPLQTPLVMTGSGETRILGNIATVNIELKRRVARFDVDNDASKTGLIIESISLGNGRTNTTLMPSTLPVFSDVDRKTKLIEYPASADFKLLPLANYGVTPSALYTYPADKTDKAYLIIKGQYQNPMQPNPVPVTYNLDITKPGGGGAPEFIDVKANTRYTLRIQEVMEATITAFFEIVDWTSGGGVIIKPDNAAPEVIGLNKEGTDVDVTTKEIDVTADGTQKIITLTATASGRVVPDMTSIEGWPKDWLGFDSNAYDAVANPDGCEYEVKDGVPTTTLRFTYTLTADEVYSPVTVTLKNTSASADESVYTKLNILPPAVAPAIAFTAAAAATGNFNSYTQTAGPPVADRKITLYKASKSHIVLGASCPFGTTVENKLAWLAVEKSATAPATRAALSPQDVTVTTPVAEYYTFTLKDVNAVSDADSKIKLINAKDDTKFAEVLVELISPEVTDIAVAELAAPALASGATLDKANKKITGVSRMGGRGFTITITSPEGVTATTLASWYTVASNNDFDPATGRQTFTVTVRNDVGDFTPAPIIFKNKIQGADDYTVTVEATAAPAFAAPGNAVFTNAAAGDAKNAYDDATKTLTLVEGADGVKLAMDCYYGISFVNNCSWLGVTDTQTEEKTDTKTATYTLKVDAAGTDGSEGTLVFKNSKKPDLQTTVTVKIVAATAPAPTPAP